MAWWQMPENVMDDTTAEPSDTPLTDVLLDQFSAYYVVTVMAVMALEEARRQRLLKEQSDNG